MLQQNIYTVNNNYKFANVNVQISVQYHRPYLSHRPHNAVAHTSRTQTLQINCKQQIYQFTQYTVNTINTIQYNSRTNADTLQKTCNEQCALPRGPTPGRWRSSHCCLLRSRHFADTTRTDTIVDTSSLQRRTSTLPKRDRRVGIHDVYPSTH